MSNEAQQAQISKERKCFKRQAETKSPNENNDSFFDNDLDWIATNNEFCSVDQMQTPSHASFIDEYEYQNMLMNLF